MKKIVIAIDGPAGAGKSSIAKQLAEKLNYLYIDTGAMYRTVTLGIIQNEINWQNKNELDEYLATLDLDMIPLERGFSIVLDGKDVTKSIRSAEVNSLVSKIAALKSVRLYLVEKQRKLASRGGVILDGRDIASVVLPQADLKIFLTASVDARVKRRWLEVSEQSDMTEEIIRTNVMERDYLDMHRSESPLICVPEAVLIDSSELSFDDTVRVILELAEEKIKSYV